MDSADPPRWPASAGCSPRIADLTWTELRDRLAAGPVLGILPLGAVEAHGPHLPLDTDRILAEAMAEAGAEELSRRGMDCVLLPAFVWTAAPFARAFPGTVDASTGRVGPLLEDVFASCRRWGLGGLVLANVHLDPAHVGLLRRLAERWTGREGWPVVFPDLTRRRWAARLGEDFRNGDHAGRWETSLVMACEPGAVRARALAALEPNPVSLVEAIADGAQSFEEAGGPEAWVGDPGAADAEHGAEQIRLLGAIVAEAVEEVGAAGRRAGSGREPPTS